MSDESMKHGHSGHESSSNAKTWHAAVFVFMIGLAIFGVVIISSSLPCTRFSIITSVRAWHRQPAGHFEGSDVACGHAGGYG